MRSRSPSPMASLMGFAANGVARRWSVWRGHAGAGSAAPAGFAYLAMIGTVLAYTLWFRGIQLLPVGSVAFLGLLSPLVAVMAGWAFLQQTLSWGQALGTATILMSLMCVFTSPGPRSTDTETR